MREHKTPESNKSVKVMISLSQGWPHASDMMVVQSGALVSVPMEDLWYADEGPMAHGDAVSGGHGHRGAPQSDSIIKACLMVHAPAHGR
jgi:hypothetical protein